MKRIYFAFAAGIIVAVVIFLAVLFSPMKNWIYSEENKSETQTVLQAFEKQGKLQVIKMYFEQVHKEEIVRDLFGVDLLAPDSKTLVTFTSVVTGCVDLQKVTAADIKVTADRIEIKLPEPELCDEPYIMADSFKVYDQNWAAMIIDPQQEIVAQQKAVELARQKALDNDMIVLAEDQAQTVLEKFLSAVTEKEVDVRY